MKANKLLQSTAACLRAYILWKTSHSVPLTAARLGVNEDIAALLIQRGNEIYWGP